MMAEGTKIRATNFHLKKGDCVAGMSELPESSVDVVVTSPPYNLGIKYGHYQDSRSMEDYLDWTFEWCSQVQRVLKDDGSFFLNIGAEPRTPLIPHQVIMRIVNQENLFQLQNTFHWIKSISVETRGGETISAGHFKPINSKRFVTDCHEFIFHLTKTVEVPLDRLAVGVPYADKSNIARWKHTGGGDKRCRGNNWFIPYDTIVKRDKDRPHPATFPVELARRCLLIHGNPKEQTVLEPFLGIGSAAVAARECGVNTFYGFEIDEVYMAEANRRLRAMD